MKRNVSFYSILLSLVALILSYRGGEVAFAADAGRTAAASPSSSLRFLPPTTGAPSVRVTGGSRGSGDASITLDVLAPDDTGVTTREQPPLFWFQSKPAHAKFDMTSLQPTQHNQLVQRTAHPPTTP